MGLGTRGSWALLFVGALLVLALLVLLMWKVRLGGGRWSQWGLGFPVTQVAFHAVVLTHPLPHLLSICIEHLPCLYQGLCRVLDILEISQCRSCPQGFDSLVGEGSLGVRRH